MITRRELLTRGGLLALMASAPAVPAVMGGLVPKDPIPRVEATTPMTGPGITHSEMHNLLADRIEKLEG